ncbi:MAG: MBL fold metallo-hydrolase [Planctomycetes bacterium]|nr:MBL fold metallo-hydrolase [Planctomycetota bacterium]
MRLLLPTLALCLAGPASAQQLEVHFLEVGQGDSTLIIGPDGTTFLFDGGNNGKGNSTLVPYLQGLGISNLDYVAVSHYHADHVGGLDEVWNAGIQATICLDRGDSNTPTTNTFNDYRSTYSSVRQTVTPGEVVSLGGGATATCLVVEGAIAGGASVDISRSAQYENSASIAWRIEYGNFDLFVGGDLTGGGNSTTDVESAVASICGDLDVLRINHHGSNTSTNPNFLSAVLPEAAIISCGAGNQYGFPRQEAVDNLNRWDRVIPIWSTTEGTGGTGFVDAGGSIILKSDGQTWSMSGPTGLNLTAHCDEVAPPALATGELVISEFQRNPTVVADDAGEWIELAGARTGLPASIVGVEISGGSTDRMELATSLRLEAGEVCVIASSGIAGTNGGIRPQIAWPAGSMQLANTADELTLRDSANGNLILDSVQWDISWPGAVGTSAERKDLLSAGVLTNFVGGSVAYGLGDLGSPDRTNDGDTTIFHDQTRVVVITHPSVGGTLTMDWHMPRELGAVYQGWVSFGTSPGIIVGGTHIPANKDQAYRATYRLPGWSGFVPTSEVVRATTKVPNNSALQGATLYGIVVTADLPDQIRTQAPPVDMIVQ